jgi:hypothetical protein
MIANAATLLTIGWTLCLTASVLRTLKNGPDRALALPTPFMLLLVCRAQLATVDPWYMPVAAYVAVSVLLYGCWQQKRNLARWAAIACGGAVLCMQLSSTLTLDR